MNNYSDDENPTRKSVIHSSSTRRDKYIDNMEAPSQNRNIYPNFHHHQFNSRPYSPYFPGLIHNNAISQHIPNQVKNFKHRYLPGNVYPPPYYTERPHVFSQMYSQTYFDNPQSEEKINNPFTGKFSSDRDISGDNSNGSSCVDSKPSYNDNEDIQDNLKRPPTNVTSDNNVKRQRTESSPPSVNSNKNLSNCNVCGDLAVAHKHYGGVCCYSCKAFFRRATQTGKDKKYKCKKDNNCDVNYTSRKSCQYCRFIKCLQIGMKPNWVLSDEQCNIRFRNTKNDETKKKCKIEVEELKQGSDGQKFGFHTEKPQIEKGLSMPFTNEETKSLNNLVSNYTLSKETFTFSDENEDLWNKLFNRNSSEVNIHEYSSFDLGSLIMTVIKKNIFFVRTNHLFTQISKNDQKLLLQKNMSEMCHIRGAIRFDTKSKNFVWYFSKKDQVQMTFEKNSPAGSRGKTHLKNALIGHQDMSKFYKDTTSSNIFYLVNKLCQIDIPMEVFLIMINIVLFSPDTLELEGKKVVEENQVKNMLFLHRYLCDLFGRDVGMKKLSQIMTFLTDLRELCDQSKNEELNYK